ncbi:MAG: ABC-F family ATP-binding cassette domain-containing protein [Gemmatimonadaceae bacterium]|nr:ABC-F family ATP-binding cassette domain-containing protein [Gemmatimonadaceae bacterium]
MTQLSLSAVSVQYGATTVLHDVTCTIGEGERWGVVGRNGSGKTSLFRLLTGDQSPTSGSIARTPGLRFAVLDQHRDFPGATTVWGAVAEAFRALIDLEDDLALQANGLAEAGEGASKAQLDRYARDLERFEHSGGYTYQSTVDAVLEGLGFNASGAREMPLAHLSGGERGRVALARQLAIPADVLLLDEPTNHLDLETTRWLEEFLRGSRETQLIISHDRAFLDRVVDHVLHLEDTTAVAYGVGYADFIRQRAERRLSQQRSFDRQAKAIAREEDYVRRNIAGQNSKQAKGRRKRLEWLPRLTPPPDDETAMSVRFEARERGGDQVVVCERVEVHMGDRVLLRPFTGWVRRGDVIGLVGPNGTGKSTLLRSIVGARALTSGEIRVGGAIQTAMYTQDFANVPRDKSLYDIIADLRPMWERGAVMGHLGRVQFSGDETRRSTSSLSGGELARLALAMMMLDGANFLIFDEPTNHLDVESIEALEDAIERYDGTVLLVSHDRELLRKLTTRVWDLRDGHMRVFDGPFDEWEEVREREEVARVAREAERTAAVRERERDIERRHADATARARTSSRELRRAVDTAEADVLSLEVRVTDLTTRMADPELYDGTPGAISRAEALARELEETRRALSRAMAVWEQAMEAADHDAQTSPQGR